MATLLVGLKNADISSSAEDDHTYERPKRVKWVSVFVYKTNSIMPCRCLTKQEIVAESLSTGKDAPLEVRDGGCAGRGLFATARILKGQWLCEYKGQVYPLGEKQKHIEEYEKNGEGSYIVSSKHPVGGGTRLCWDATRYVHQYGRYINHALQPNAALTHPCHITGKWRIGFLAIMDVEEGHEIVWDYGVGKEVGWGRSRLVDGVVFSSLDDAGPSQASGEEEVRLCKR